MLILSIVVLYGVSPMTMLRCAPDTLTETPSTRSTQMPPSSYLFLLLLSLLLLFYFYN